MESWNNLNIIESYNPKQDTQNLPPTKVPPEEESSEDESQASLSKTLSDIDQMALKALEEVGARTYRLTGVKDPDNPIVWKIGCEGSKGQAQQQVAALMNHIAATEPHKRPDFIVFKGDNFYHYGVKKPTDKKFITHFDDIYGDEICPALANIPIFLLPGNHDANIQMELLARMESYLFLLDQGRHRELYQAAHTYVPDGKKFQTTEELFNVFKQETLDLAKLQKFNEPFPFYSLITGNKKQEFFLDSNFLLHDYIDYKEKKAWIHLNRINQIEWLLTEAKKAREAGRENIFNMHHTYRTSGKRAEPDGHDSNQYLLPEQITQLNGYFGTNTTSYNELIYLTLKDLGLIPHQFFGAHDHFICIDDNGEYLIVTNGAGGANLQMRKVAIRHPDVKLSLSQHGVTIASNHTIETYTISGLHLVYDIKKHEFIRKPSIDDNIERLRKCALAAHDKFFNLLKEKEQIALHEKNKKVVEPPTNYFYSSYIANAYTFFSNVSHQASKKISNLVFHNPLGEEMKCADEMAAYFNQVELPNYRTVIDDLSKILEPLTNRAEHPAPKSNGGNKNSNPSFYHLFQEIIKRELGEDFTLQQKWALKLQYN